MKTDGQIVYEHYHPSHVEVVLASALPFATKADVFLVPNPDSPTPWRHLTPLSQKSWERTAEGHHVIQSRNANHAT